MSCPSTEDRGEHDGVRLSCSTVGIYVRSGNAEASSGSYLEMSHPLGNQ